MGALDNFLNKAKSVTQTAGKKASDALEVTRLNLAVSDAQSDIDNMLRDIGKIVYKNYEDRIVLTDSELEDKCIEIDAKNAQIKEIKDKIRSLKNLRICPQCNETNAMANAHCAKCGAKLEMVQEDEFDFIDLEDEEADIYEETE